MDRDLLLAKLATIERCLNRITSVTASPGLIQVDRDDIVVLNLQRAIQAVIDSAAHIVSSKGYGLPDTIAAEFTLLAKHGDISPQLAERLRKMVGFRNIAVHEYETLDPAIVEAIVRKHLQDLKDYAQVVAALLS